jgi:predicted metal-binding membrane protein
MKPLAAVSAAPTLLRRAVDHPHALFWAALALVVASAWVRLALMARGSEEASLTALLTASLCSADGAAVTSWQGFGALAAMWAAMAFAMMLPTAAPMISTYLDIAGAARAKAMAIVPAGVLVAGYMTVWLAFALAAAAVQTALAAPVAALGLPPLLHLGALMLAAGLYQRSPVKHACLTKCRRPMPYFLARWSDTAPGVYRMGLEQGALCLGCCLGLMALMFAGAFMNLAVMAALAVLMLAEKAHPKGEAVSRFMAFALIGAGLFLIGSSMVWEDQLWQR